MQPGAQASWQDHYRDALSTRRQGWWAHTKKSGCHCQHETWGIPRSPGRAEASFRTDLWCHQWTAHSGAPLRQSTSRCPQLCTHTHTDRPQSRSKEKQHVADGAGREALTFRQCPSSNLYWQSLTLCSLWPRNAQSPVRYPKQVCGAESHQLMTGTQSLEVLLPSQSNKRNCHWLELWFSKRLQPFSRLSSCNRDLQFLKNTLLFITLK